MTAIANKRLEDSRLPRTPADREALAEIIGADGFHLLDNIYSQTSPIELRQLPAVEVLRQVWLQQYYAPTDKIELRSDKDGPPSAVRIRSPYDLDARNSTKRTTNWTGYKVHLTESCDEDSPHIITHVETTVATTQDQTVVPSIHQSLAQKNLLPQQHLVDQGYTSSQLLSSSERDYDIDLFGPVAVNGAWQAKAGLGFDVSHFRVNWKRKVVYCPQGKRSSRWKHTQDAYGHPVIHVNFRTKDCKNCAVRSQCTRAANDPRALTIQAQPDYEALQKGRERQKTEEFQKQYALCSGLTRADYLEHIVRHNASPCITREDSEFLAPHQEENEPQPSITRQKEFSLTSYPASERQSVALPRVVELEILRDAFGAA